MAPCMAFYVFNKASDEKDLSFVSLCFGCACFRGVFGSLIHPMKLETPKIMRKTT